MHLKSEYLIKSVDMDEYNKYLCTSAINGNGQSQLSFSHYEFFQIPEELFIGEQGIISFLLIAYDIDMDSIASGTSFNVNYKVINDDVYLFVPSK